MLEELFLQLCSIMLGAQSHSVVVNKKLVLPQLMSSNLCAYRMRYTSATTVLQSMSIYYTNRTTDGLQEQFFNLDI